MSMATRSQTRLGVQRIDPGLASGDGVRAVHASSSLRSRGGTSAGPDPLELGPYRDGASFLDRRGRDGLTGHTHRDRGESSAQTQAVRGRPGHDSFTQDRARSNDPRRDRGPSQDEVERESSATDTLAYGVPSLSAHVQEGRGFDITLPHMGRLHDLDASSLPRPKADMTNSAPSRQQGRRGISNVLPGTASGHKGLPRSFEERLAEDMLDEGLSPKNPA